jgi:hypothetical protein
MGRGGKTTIQFDKLYLGSVIMPKVMLRQEASIDPAVALLFLKDVSFLNLGFMWSILAFYLAC